MKKVLLTICIAFFMISCGSTKYTYVFEKEKNIDFSQGKWILNEPYTNNPSGRIQQLAFSEFKAILKDSLFELNDLRKNSLITSQVPFDPTENDLKDLKIGTDCDYMINIKSNIIKSEMGSFAVAPHIGTTKKTNQAESTIKIYDLNNLILLSESTVIGKEEEIKSSDDDSWEYVNTASTISWKGLVKLIKKYNKNRVRKK